MGRLAFLTVETPHAADLQAAVLRIQLGSIRQWHAWAPPGVSGREATRPRRIDCALLQQMNGLLGVEWATSARNRIRIAGSLHNFTVARFGRLSDKAVTPEGLSLYHFVLLNVWAESAALPPSQEKARCSLLFVKTAFAEELWRPARTDQHDPQRAVVWVHTNQDDQDDASIVQAILPSSTEVWFFQK